MVIGSTKEKIAEIKRRYGLVPLEHESYTGFLGRVQKTIKEKRDPLTSPLMKNKKKRIEKEYTKRIQEVTQKYLGIEEEPIDAYKTKKSLTDLLAGGLTLPDKDGSMIICIQHGKDNYYDLVSNLTQGLGSIIGGNGDIGKVHHRLIKDLMGNEEHICLHEGVHANDLNNKPEQTKRLYDKVFNENDKVKLTAIVGMLTPVVRMFYKLPIMNHSIETETLAYKTAFDEFTSRAFKDAKEKLDWKGVDTFNLERILENFKMRNSDLMEKVIKYSYIGRQGYKGFVTTAASVAVSYIIANYCLGNEKPFWNYFNGSEHVVWNTIGTYMYIQIFDKLAGFFIGIQLRNKIKKCRRIYDQVVAKFESAGKAFYETLGMNFKDMEDYLKE